MLECSLNFFLNMITILCACRVPPPSLARSTRTAAHTAGRPDTHRHSAGGRQRLTSRNPCTAQTTTKTGKTIQARSFNNKYKHAYTYTHTHPQKNGSKNTPTSTRQINIKTTGDCLPAKKLQLKYTHTQQRTYKDHCDTAQASVRSVFVEPAGTTPLFLWTSCPADPTALVPVDLGHGDSACRPPP